MRTPSILLLCSLCLGLLFLTAGPVAAQTAVTTVSESQGTLSEEAQARLYKKLLSQTEYLQKQSEIIKTVAKLLGPAVVHIEADVDAPRSLQHGQVGQVEEAGSGVIIKRNDKYFVLTNRHVIRGASSDAIRITLADRRVLHPLPLRVWEDPETDIAVMEISAPQLIPARVGDSDAVEIGDFVLAAGSPFGLSHSITFGIVSAKNRRALELGGAEVKYQDFIQTDAAINPGNSGGPLINLRGEVIGINTAIASNSGGSEGIGFAIPIKMFMSVAGQLIDKGRVERAFFGVTIDSVYDTDKAREKGLPRAIGAMVKEVTPDSPAAKAKLQPGDVVLLFENVPVIDDNHLVNLISLSELGKDVSMVVFRDGKELVVHARLASKKDFNIP